MNNELLVAAEAAELLRVSKQRMYELARNREVPTVRIGVRQYRFSRAALLEFIRSGGTGIGLETNLICSKGGNDDD